VVLVGTNVDRLRSEVEKNQKKAEFVKLIYNKYLVGGNNRDLRERGLPKIIEIAFVGCPPNGKTEGIVELRQILYDVAFNLTLPKGMHICGCETSMMGCLLLNNLWIAPECGLFF